MARPPLARASRRCGYGVPEFRAVSLADRAGKRGAWTGGAWRATGGASETRRGRDRPDRAGRFRKRLSKGAVGRHAPARRPRACSGGAPRSAADGRAVQRTRCADRGEPAHRPDRPVVGRQAAGPLRADGDAQHRGGGADVRPHPGVRLEPRPRRQRIACAVSAPAQPAGSRVPTDGGRHLRSDDSPPGAKRSRGGASAGRHRHAAATRRHQSDGRPDGGTGRSAHTMVAPTCPRWPRRCNTRSTNCCRLARRCSCCTSPCWRKAMSI